MGSHCWECVKAARPPAKERIRRWNASPAGSSVVTIAIVILNFGIFLLTSNGIEGVRLRNDLVAFGPLVHDGEWYRLVTAGFVHFDIFHIAFNMIIVYRFGQMLETALGRSRFLALYFAALLAGSLGAMIFEPVAATGGASGAALGLVAAAGIGLHVRGINIWQSGIGPLLLINLLLSFRPGISLGGHLGGAVGGALAGWFMLRLPDRSGAKKQAAFVEGMAAGLIVCAIALVGGIWAAGNI